MDDERLITDELKALMIRNETEQYLPFKKVDQRKLRDITKKVNVVIRHTETDHVPQTNKQTCYGSSPLGCKRSWSEERRNRREKRAMMEQKNESDITNLRRDINRLERERRGEARGKRKRKIKELNTKYRVKKKGINLVIEELKQRLIAKTKVKRYEQRISRFRQN